MIRIVGFDWDAANIEKCQKHGVSLSMIEEIFLGEPLISSDIKHSATEERYIAIGRTFHRRVIFVAFTFREAELGLLIRPITARYMHEREIRKYEKTFTQVQD